MAEPWKPTAVFATPLAGAVALQLTLHGAAEPTFTVTVDRLESVEPSQAA